MPNWSHLWQRFLLTSSLLVGLAIGVAATIFGYSNLSTVNVHWSVIHLDGIPLWTVAVVPLAVTLIVGTLYHWSNSLHHFSEHMRHRHRVHELEAEVAALRSHLDQVLEMPDHGGAAKGARVSLPEPVEELPDAGPFGADAVETSALPEATPEPAPQKSTGDRRKRVKLTVAPEPVQPNGESATLAPAAEAPAEPAIPVQGA